MGTSSSKAILYQVKSSVISAAKRQDGFRDTGISVGNDGGLLPALTPTFSDF
jgi:hypothetical protein